MRSDIREETVPTPKTLTERAALARFSRITKWFGWTVVLFFALAFFGSSLRLPIPKFLDSLMQWGPGGAEQYEQMISVINIVWGIYVLRAAEDPFSNVLFFDFTATGMVAHITLMTLMGIFNAKDRVHLIGDILVGWAAIGPFTYVWIQTRQELGL